jgi:hypothetical protein
MPNPDQLEREHTLLTAAARYDDLRGMDALAAPTFEEDLPDGDGQPVSHGAPPLGKEEALELLALGEVLARKAGYGRQLGVRSARSAGASWAQIGEALGTSKQAAWEAHNRWIEELTQAHRHNAYEGFDEQQADAARRLAGDPEAGA